MAIPHLARYTSVDVSFVRDGYRFLVPDVDSPAGDISDSDVIWGIYRKYMIRLTLSVIIGVYRLLSESNDHCRSLLIIVGVYRLLSVIVGVCRLLSESVGYCRSLSAFVGIIELKNNNSRASFPVIVGF